jgi:hypothetical protein
MDHRMFDVHEEATDSAELEPVRLVNDGDWISIHPFFRQAFLTCSLTLTCASSCKLVRGEFFHTTKLTINDNKRTATCFSAVPPLLQTKIQVLSMHTQHVEQGHFFPRRWKAPVNCQRVSSLVKSCTNIHFVMKGPMLIIALGEQRYIHATVNLDSRPIMLLWRKPRRLFLAHSPLQFGFLLSSLAAKIGWACSGTDIPVGLLLGFFFHWGIHRLRVLLCTASTTAKDWYLHERSLPPSAPLVGVGSFSASSRHHSRGHGLVVVSARRGAASCWVCLASPCSISPI